MLLEGKIAIVTGCNRGIGLSIAENFIQNGAKVYAIFRDSNSIESLRTNTQSWPGLLVLLCLDVRNATSVKEAFVRIKKNEGRLDCLVKNAGILVGYNPSYVKSLDAQGNLRDQCFCCV